MKQKILIHACCAHCLAYVHYSLQDKYEIVVFESNPNTQPFIEYKKRQEALIKFCEIKNLELHLDNYKQEEWFDYLKDSGYNFKDLISKKETRCKLCYELRFKNTITKAKELNIKIITTTLLYSIYQNHESLKKTGQQLCDTSSITYHYEDFRHGWKKGFEIYKPLNLYLQNYCGCIFSNQEKFSQ